MNLPTGKIGNVRISRLICGSNPIIGSAHDRDLIYVAALMRQYFTDRRIMDLWRICEECGVNTMIGPADSPHAYGEDPTLRVYKRYRRGGRQDPVDRTDIPERRGPHRLDPKGRGQRGRRGLCPGEHRGSLGEAQSDRSAYERNRVYQEQWPDRRLCLPWARGSDDA